jgi:hypothetical protein
MGIEQGGFQKPSKFESFKTSEEIKSNLFVNLYGGHYADSMELNRKAIERVLKLAHLDGKVFLTSRGVSRDRSIDANPDGSVTSKKSLFIREKPEDEDKNPYSRVISIPEGWKIEINDQRIMEELIDKRMSEKKTKATFVNKFDNLLGEKLLQCIVQEKLSTIKDKNFKYKLYASTANPVIQALLSALFKEKWPIDFIANTVFPSLLAYTICNSFPRLVGSSARKTDHLWEYVLPSVEIDKVAESSAYLFMSGQKLVREKKDQARINY